MSGTTGFFTDERCFWHFGGNYAFMAPVRGYVQPMVGGGLPENPETKRRLVNLLRASGLIDRLAVASAPAATIEDLRRCHPAPYLDEFKRLSDAGGGELGLRTPFGHGGFEIAALSAGLVKAALAAVLTGDHANAYALSRPPGHHCLPDTPMGFCLLANAAIAIEAALADGLAERIAVIDWDVHHGNGTEHIFYERADVLTISVHQENNFPPGSGGFDAQGRGAGEGCNINVPLLPGGGEAVYLHAFERIVLPAVRRFRPDAIVVACGFDAAGVDPLSRMMLSAQSFGRLTQMVMDLAGEVCGGRLLLEHEGGYSEMYVPFCGHRAIEALVGAPMPEVEDPLHSRLTSQQPNARFDAFHKGLVDEMAGALGL